MSYPLSHYRSIMEDWGRAHLAGARRTHHENPKFAHGWGIRGEATLRAGMSILKSGERPEYQTLDRTPDSTVRLAASRNGVSFPINFGVCRI